MLQSGRSGRLNECLVLEGSLQERLTMAGVLHFTLLLFLHCGSFVLISSRPADDSSAVRSTVDSDAAFTTTGSLFSTGNSTQVPTTGLYSKSTTKPPKTTATTEHRTGGSDKTADRAVPRKEVEEEEEGPLEFGECIF